MPSPKHPTLIDTPKLRTLFSSPKYIIIENILIFIFLFFAILSPSKYQQLRYLFLIFILAYTLSMLNLQNLSLKDLGITSKNIRPAFSHLNRFTIPMTLITIWVYFYNPTSFLLPSTPTLQTLPKLPLVVFYFFISTPIQELFFRGYLLRRLLQLNLNLCFTTLYLSTIFSLIHLPAGNYLLPTITFFASILWTLNTYLYQNLYPSIIAHGILGGLVFFLPIFFAI